MVVGRSVVVGCALAGVAEVVGLVVVVVVASVVADALLGGLVVTSRFKPANTGRLVGRSRGLVVAFDVDFVVVGVDFDVDVTTELRSVVAVALTLPSSSLAKSPTPLSSCFFSSLAAGMTTGFVFCENFPTARLTPSDV